MLMSQYSNSISRNHLTVKVIPSTEYLHFNSDRVIPKTTNTSFVFFLSSLVIIQRGKSKSKKVNVVLLS